MSHKALGFLFAPTQVGMPMKKAWEVSRWSKYIQIHPNTSSKETL